MATDKLDLVIKMIDELKKDNTKDHDKVFEQIEKMKCETNTLKFSKAQLAGLTAIITTLCTGILQIVQAFN